MKLGVGVSKVGSVSWRWKNYGALPMFDYLIGYRRQYEPQAGSNLSLNEFFTRITEHANLDLISLSSESTNAVKSLKLEYSKAINTSRLVEIKRSLFEEQVVDLRLVIIYFLIRMLNPDVFFETGTQFGMSSNIAARAFMANGKFDYGSVQTFDTKDFPQLVVNPLIKRHLGGGGVRPYFKKSTKEFATSNSIFFHDSDHSYENMFFEFEYVYNALGVTTIISDDVDSNMAFADFCHKYHLKNFRVGQEGMPTIGCILQNP